MSRLRNLLLTSMALGVCLALIATPASGRGLKVVKVAKNVPTIFFEGDRLDPSLRTEMYGAWANARHKRRILGQYNDPKAGKPGWTPACCGRIFYEYAGRFFSIKVDGSNRRRYGRVPDGAVTALDAAQEGALSQRLGLYVYLSGDASRVILMDIRSGTKKTIYSVPGPAGPPGPDTPSPPTPSSPVISPGGQRIGFLLDRGCPPPDYTCLPTELYVVNRDGSGAHQALADADGINTAFAFSWDASRIVFPDDEIGGMEVPRDLHTVNAAGGSQVQLTNTPGTTEGTAIYSTDGQRLAYHDVESSSIFVINSGGGGRLRLTIARKEPRFGFDIPMVWDNITWEKRRRR